jgi:tetratricopeptide (TPR) repeat protein
MILGRRRRRKADKLLAKGDITGAIEIYREEKAWDGVVAAYEQQGEFLSAAEAAEEGELFEQAGELFERAGSFKRAAEVWLGISQQERAARALEKGEDFLAAADLYKSLQMDSQAAAALAAAGQYAGAGQLYEHAGETDRAFEMYRAADKPQDMARIAENAGKFEEAARLCEEAGNKGKAAELFAKANMLLESARCHREGGNCKEAGDTLLSCERLFEAAEAYEKDESTLKQAGRVFGKVLRGQEVWRREVPGPISCLSVSEDGARNAVGCGRKLVVLNQEGELLWRFVPTWGGTPCCVAMSPDGALALGCDDNRLYFLDSDKNILWTHDLPGEAMKVSISPTGEWVACCAKGNYLVCLDNEGSVKWDYRAQSIIWDVDISGDGEAIAFGTADGSCIVMDAKRRKVGEYKGAKWVHSVSLSTSGDVIALGTGIQGVEFVDARKLEPIWTVQDSSPVHSVVVTADTKVLSVADDGAILRDEDATVVWRHDADERLMGGDIAVGGELVLLRCVGRKVVRIDLHRCTDRAAGALVAAGSYPDAAALYEEMQDYESAAEMFSKAGDCASAARNLEIAGRHVAAADLCQQVGNFLQAATLFEAGGELAKSAACFERAGQPLKAAELFCQIGDLAKAADAFDEAGEHGRAGELHRKMENTQAAVEAFERHVELHPDDWEKQFELGVLLQDDGQYDAAIEHFQQAASDEECRRKAVQHVAECFMGKDMYEIAIERYRACVTSGETASRGNRDIFYGLGKAYHLAGKYADAKRVYESILGIDFRYKDVQERLDDVRKLTTVFQGQRQTGVVGQPTVIIDQQFQRLSSDEKERYVPLEKLGEGGMGTVYLAEDKRLNRKVALKMLPASLQADEKMRLRIVHEAQLIAQVTHPNVVGVYDVGEEQGSSYVSMEYVQGRTVREILDEKGRYDARECVALLLQITNGLGYAHGRGVSHRDIKPENIMVTEDGTAKIMDFGLALNEGATRLTMPGQISGSPLYMAPEQLRGEEGLTPAADIYAVGCMAYELLTGNPPFTEGNVGIQHLNEPPKALKKKGVDVPAALEEVIMKCLAKDRAERYPNGASLNKALREVEKAL